MYDTTTAIAQFSPIKARLSELTTQYGHLKEITIVTPDQYKLVDEGRKAAKKARLEIESIRKTIGEDARLYVSTVNSTAKDAAAPFVQLEESLEARQQAYDAEQARKAAEIAEQEKQRVGAIVTKLATVGLKRAIDGSFELHGSPINPEALAKLTQIEVDIIYDDAKVKQEAVDREAEAAKAKADEEQAELARLRVAQAAQVTQPQPEVAQLQTTPISSPEIYNRPEPETINEEYRQAHLYLNYLSRVVVPKLTSARLLKLVYGTTETIKLNLTEVTNLCKNYGATQIRS